MNTVGVKSQGQSTIERGAPDSSARVSRRLDRSGSISRLSSHSPAPPLPPAPRSDPRLLPARLTPDPATLLSRGSSAAIYPKAKKRNVRSMTWGASPSLARSLAGLAALVGPVGCADRRCVTSLARGETSRAARARWKWHAWSLACVVGRALSLAHSNRSRPWIAYP